MNSAKAQALLALCDLLDRLPDRVTMGFVEDFKDEKDHVEFKIQFSIDIPPGKARK